MKNLRGGKTPFEKRNFYKLSDTGAGFLGAVIAPYAVSLIVLIVCYLIMQGGTSMSAIEGSIAYKIISCFVAPIGFCVLLFSFNKIKGISFKATKVKFNIKIWDLLITFTVALICLFGMKYLIGGFDHLLEGWGFKFSQFPLPLDNAGWLVLSLLLVAVLPAVFEELVFRGMLLNGLRKKMGDVGAIFMSGMLFAIMHGSIEQLIYQFVLGVVLGWLAVRTGSTFCSMIAHFLNNAMVLIVEFISRQSGGAVLEYNAWQWVLSIGLVLISAGLIFIIERFYFKHKNHVIEEKQKKAGPAETEQEKSVLDAEKAGLPDERMEKYPITLWIAIAFCLIINIIVSVNGFM